MITDTNIEAMYVIKELQFMYIYHLPVNADAFRCHALYIVFDISLLYLFFPSLLPKICCISSDQIAVLETKVKTITMFINLLTFFDLQNDTLYRRFYL